jgi:hypothetical protein
MLAADVLAVTSLPNSYYDDDEGFQALKFAFIGNIEISDVTESITLYLKKVQGMEQKLQLILARHVP